MNKNKKWKNKKVQIQQREEMCDEKPLCQRRCNIYLYLLLNRTRSTDNHTGYIHTFARS